MCNLPEPRNTAPQGNPFGAGASFRRFNGLSPPRTFCTTAPFATPSRRPAQTKTRCKRMTERRLNGANGQRERRARGASRVRCAAWGRKKRCGRGGGVFQKPPIAPVLLQSPFACFSLGAGSRSFSSLRILRSPLAGHPRQVLGALVGLQFPSTLPLRSLQSPSLVSVSATALARPSVPFSYFTRCYPARSSRSGRSNPLRFPSLTLVFTRPPSFSPLRIYRLGSSPRTFSPLRLQIGRRQRVTLPSVPFAWFLWRDRRPYRRDRRGRKILRVQFHQQRPERLALQPNMLSNLKLESDSLQSRRFHAVHSSE